MHLYIINKEQSLPTQLLIKHSRHFAGNVLKYFTVSEKKCLVEGFFFAHNSRREIPGKGHLYSTAEL